MLHQFITDKRERILAHTRELVAKRSAPKATPEELSEGVPVFLDQLVELLGPAESTLGTRATMADTASVRGGKLQRSGFTVGQVVHDYGDVCQAVTAVAAEGDVVIPAFEFRRLNLALDDAIALAVTSYVHQRERHLAGEEVERMTSFAQEMRNLVSSATLAYEVVRRGSVGVGGSTGAVLGRSLAGMSELLDRNLVLLRLDQKGGTPERFPVAFFLEDIEISSMNEASARSIRLAIGTTDLTIEVLADRQILASAVASLVQGALRHSRPGGEVSVRTTVEDGRVYIAVADACGGLGPGGAERVLATNGNATVAGNRERRLSICRRAVHACGGELRLIDRAGSGCTFTIDLPSPPRLEVTH